MKYLYSQVDKDNAHWFDNDMTVASLRQIQLTFGTIRGLHPFSVKFDYPISVIAGINRCGKTTLLAIAACAFHNIKTGFKLPERKLPYYTFSDFFVQTAEEISPEGILIRYNIMNNKWAKTKEKPDGIGFGWQNRTKKVGGKWNKYERRIDRSVVFFGFQRVVPHSEKSVSKSYRALFLDQDVMGWETKVKETVGRILGTVYDDFKIKVYLKYHMPVVKSHSKWYSGFNMGAGENALFEIFSTIYNTPKGTLMVIDEIELGLHPNAQIKLMNELKEACRDRHIQVICTTHSAYILDAVPPEARYYIDSYTDNTVITQGISSLYASGKLSGKNSGELAIFVEDGIANILLESFIPPDVRKRINIIPIGSSTAIIRQMAARYKDFRHSECMAVLDGDKSSTIAQHRSHFMKTLEKNIDIEKEEEWFTSRLTFMPSEKTPEKWLLLTIQSMDISSLADQLQVSNGELNSFIEEASTAKKHYEIFTLGKNLALDPSFLCRFLANWLCCSGNTEFLSINQKISNLLS